MVTAEFFWQALEPIDNIIMELCALQYLFVRGSNKQQTRGRIIWILQNERLLSSLIANKCSWGKSHDAPSLLALSKKGLSSSSVWSRQEYTWILIWKKSLLLLIVNIASTCKRFWEIAVYLFLSHARKK